MQCKGCNTILAIQDRSSDPSLTSLGFKKSGISWCKMCFWVHPDAAHRGQPYVTIEEIIANQTKNL